MWRYDRKLLARQNGFHFGPGQTVFPKSDVYPHLVASALDQLLGLLSLGSLDQKVFGLRATPFSCTE